MDKKTFIIIFLAAVLLLGLGFLASGLAARGNAAGLIFRRDFLEIKPREEQDGAITPAAAKAPVKETKPALCEIAGEPLRNSIVINELAWMGSVSGYADEWIELKNISSRPVDAGGWQIQNKKRKIKIFFPKSAVIPAAGLFLLERTDDEAVPGVKANLIYSGSLANENEGLYLLDGECRLHDSVFASPKWPAGDNVSKRIMERRTDLLWQTSKDAGGTPGTENSAGK